MITREEFNTDKSYYYLSSMERVFLPENRSQYLLKVTFNRLNDSFYPKAKKIIYNQTQEGKNSKYNEYLSKFIFCENSSQDKVENQVSVLLSFKEFPYLVWGTIWHKGKIVLGPNEYLTEQKIILNNSFKKPFIELSAVKSLKQPWNLFPDSLSKMNVFQFDHPNGTRFILPVYEAIRAFYCESSSVADSCFNGKTIFHKTITEHSRQFFNVSKDEGFVILERHIEDQRAGLALRLMENENYYTQFCNVFRTIMDKDNNGPLIHFPIDWETEITYHGTNLYRNVVFINCITNYTDHQSKFTSGKFGRVNDGRKGENSKDQSLKKLKGPKRGKVEGEIGDLPIVDNVQTDSGLELARIAHGLVNPIKSKLTITKVDKTIQFYTNDKSGITYTDGKIELVTTNAEYEDGSKAGGLHLHGESDNIKLTFPDILKNLKHLIDTTFRVDAKLLKNNNEDYEFIARVATDKKEIRSWCYMILKKGVYSAGRRRIGIYMFEIKDYYCYVFEIEKRVNGKGSAIGVVLSKLDLSKIENKPKIDHLMQTIKIKEGQLEKIDQNEIPGLLFSSQRHRTNENGLSSNLRGKVEKMIKIGI